MSSCSNKKFDKKHKIIEIFFDRDYIWDDHNYFIQELKDIETLKKIIIK